MMTYAQYLMKRPEALRKGERKPKRAIIDKLIACKSALYEMNFDKNDIPDEIITDDDDDMVFDYENWDCTGKLLPMELIEELDALIYKENSTFGSDFMIRKNDLVLKCDSTHGYHNYIFVEDISKKPKDVVVEEFKNSAEIYLEDIIEEEKRLWGFDKDDDDWEDDE